MNTGRRFLTARVAGIGAILACAAICTPLAALTQEWTAAQPATTQTTPAKKTEAAKPEKPGLKVGDKAPDATLIGADGKEVRLASLWKDGPVVVTFYRGGWCPYCNTALAAWREKISDLKTAGARLVAISPETPEHLHSTKEKAKTDYVALCDAKMDAATGFKVIFRLDEPTQEKYRGFGVDLKKHNQGGEWDLPAPGTFVIDQTGTVRWAWAEWDYKKRADPDEVIKAVKGLTEPVKKDAGGK